MVRLGKNFGWALVLASGMLFPARGLKAQAAAPQAGVSQGATAATTQATSKARPRRKKATPVAEVPPTPAPPLTLEQTPPTAPTISYKNGQLTIDAHNSTLSQVLRGVQLQTGASMDIPGSANNERVVAQIGPGQPHDVLNTLLNGSKFDYVILGVTGSPGAVQKVILSPRQSTGASSANSAQNNAPPPQESMGDEEQQPDEGVPVADTNGMENQTPEQVPPPPGNFRRSLPVGQQPPDQSPFGQGESQNVVKTPEQLMQELQQMQQQQQQYQEQLNPSNQTPQ